MADIQTIAETTGGRGKLADLIVLIAMTAFSLALAVGFNHQLGLPVWLSGGVAASIFAGCLALHLLLHRSIKIGRLEAEVARLKRQGARGGAMERRSAVPVRAQEETAVGPASPAPAAEAAVSGTEAPAVAIVAECAPVVATAATAADVPSAEVELEFAPLAAPIAQADEGQPAKTTDPRPTDFEMIQSLVKKLADDVAANEQRGADSAARTAVSTETATDASVEALKATADTLQRQSAAAKPLAPTFASHPSEAVDQQPATTAVPAAPAAARPARFELIALASALKGQRIDVMLEPILGLREQRPSHYEVSLRFRDEEGDKLDIIERPAELSGSGLLPLIDIARLSRTAEVARRLKARGADGAVFSDLAAESLVDDDFLNRVAAAYRAETQFADGLVMAFTQREARAFTPAQWETLFHMRDLGFRFSLKDITDLDMDFEALGKAGFQFAKLDAEVFLVGLPMDGGTLPSRDICRHLADAGLALIVGHIGDERQLVSILGFGALFGQGALFGEPRPMKAELFTRPASAAA